MVHFPPEIYYSKKYSDQSYEYRHVILPKQLWHTVKSRYGSSNLLQEQEWRAIGIEMSPGWEHYWKFPPEPHILLFRRSMTTNNSRTSFFM